MATLFETETQASHAGYARVALEQSIDVGEGLTYRVPEALADLEVGERVRVPLGRGNKPTPGWVIERMAESGFEQTKPVFERDPVALRISPELIALARWMAGYYVTPIGMVLATMMPASVKRGTGTVLETLAAVTERGRRVAAGEVLEDEQGRALRVTALQRAVLEAGVAAALQGDEGAEGWVEIHRLADLGGARTVGPIRSLAGKGLLETRRVRSIRAGAMMEATEAPPPPGGHELTGDQQRVIGEVTGALAGGFSVHLLHGVTGSGKTEVYLRVIEALFEQAAGEGQAAPGVIVLVPEISLTPQTAGRFIERFRDVAVLHSGLSAAQRHQQWERLATGEARIAVGARSAIFAPLPTLGLIVVDEEHDTSYKQDQLPRYHARDVAIKRGHLAGVPVVLGSATPSLESWLNAMGEAAFPPPGEGAEAPPGAAPAPSPARPGLRPRYRLHELPGRVAGMKLPNVEIVDLVAERRARRGVHLISQRLESLLERAFGAGHQAILLLNRRGFANWLACPDYRCGWQLMCEHCDAMMVYHKHAQVPEGGYVQCHHCHAEQRLPPRCPDCSKKVSVFGLGTQRVEEELARKLPEARIRRMDSDVMHTAADYHQALEAFRRRELDMLVGTQMIAKGLDFPSVRVVGVVSADTGLHMPDFRASERTFQLIAQVAGRAGRIAGEDGAPSGEVVVQSFNPADPTIGLAARHDYTGFARRELALRREAGLPPVTRMARIVIRDTDHEACEARSRKLADALERENGGLAGPVRLQGPHPCPIARIANHHRRQIELIAETPAPLQRLFAALRRRGLLRSDTHTAVDVDPVNLL